MAPASGERALRIWGQGGFRIEDAIDRHWRSWTLIAWALVVAWFFYTRWANIQWLALGDTDDNLRLAQVRAWLDGQGWYDLRQYRLDPNWGLNIHWSRIVDLPLAGLILFFRLFTSPEMAERLACGLAPLLPLGVAMGGIVLAARRLISPLAWPLALIVLMGCTSTMMMFAPMRIDHHGWQLACLAMTVAGLADPRQARGGATVGGFSALSLAIGLELLPYCVMAGGIVALRWVWDGREARRLMTYALTLAGGCAIGFAGFASVANQAIRCDALTPVWLSAMLATGALLFALAWLNPASRWTRLALAAAAAVLLAGAFATLFPQCLARPEGVSDELYRTWLANVREARPIYRHPLKTGFPLAVLPIIGVIGAGVAAWRWRGTGAAVGWAAVALFTAFSGAMLLWQVRAGPAAQLLSVPGATALAWIVVPWFLSRGHMLVRVFGSIAAFLLVSGLFAGLVLPYLPADKPQPGRARVNQANANCSRLTTLRTLNAVPRATMFTHVDLGPRLIVVTHHNGIAGPYHRNERAILDVHRAFRGPASGFRDIARYHGAHYVLLCPNLAESTVYRARSPNGFYAQLHRGQVPDWLEPVDLPENSPFRLWRIDYAMPDGPEPRPPVSAPRPRAPRPG